MDDFLKYYEGELTFTRELMAEFARKYPKIAARLQLEPDKCEDPHMERLIEGFAFECARLRMKIDDHFPEIVEPLLNLVFPHFIRPIPSMSVVRFEPTMTTIPPSGSPMDKKIAIFAKTNEAVCQFTTVYPVTLWPAEVVSAELREPGKLVKDAKQAIVIKLKTHNGLGLDQIGWKKLRFFINGQDRQAFGTYELLLNNTCLVECIGRNRDGKTETASMPPDCIRPVGFEPDEAMLPSLRKEFPGFLLLFEYFCFPEKFLFIDFNGFDKFRPKDADSLEIWIYINREAGSGLLINRESFSLHCTPVVNLFEEISEPIDANPDDREYLVIPHDSEPDASEINSISKVVGTKRGSPPVIFHSLYSLGRHLLEEDRSGKPFWHMQRRPSCRKDDHGTDVFISFCDQDLNPADPAVDQIIVHSECTNRDLAAKLSYGDPSGDLIMEGSAPISRINLVLKPTSSRRPAVDGVLQWQAISSLKPNYLPLMRGQEEAFRAVIRLYDFSNTPESRRVVNGIRTVQSRHVTRRIGQAFFRGVEITIGFDESEYEDSGLFMFTSVLERFLGQFVSLNSFTQLFAKTVPGGKLFKVWPPRRGVRPQL